MVANEARIVNMDQLRAESVGVQIKVAFGVLSMRNEPDETKRARAVAQLQQIFNSLQ